MKSIYKPVLTGNTMTKHAGLFLRTPSVQADGIMTKCNSVKATLWGADEIYPGIKLTDVPLNS